MSHTEEEAKKLWCPQARVVRYGNDICGNRHSIELDSSDPSGFAKCIGSNCMMWRWAQKPNPDWSPSMSQMQWPQKDTRNDTPMYIDDTTLGYCGLGGRQ